jgi:transcription initiation factor TFIIIB Brf1 subunit/transcription initiation factor TFIIB
VKSLTSIFLRIHCEKITSAARIVWVNQEIADEIAQSALQILAKASKQNLRFFCGKSPKCILGGLFYILGFRFNSTITQREIADLLCTTEDSIRKSYKRWLIEFPQFFTDINALKLPKVEAIYQELNAIFTSASFAPLN